MWKSSARELAAWKAAWSITLRPCERGWSTTYKCKGCSIVGLLDRELNYGTCSRRPSVSRLIRRTKQG